ncbi:hypothetical protein SAMN06295987_101800 [Novosphingobium mathurense]|uniref:Uncharacterized protein n=2 Tax=Novosphingobium mathurense TaxID=428990 RepID=A0A1U6GXZ4_9SPHN|nr:hypothetical protein SAMN06295987_101800 [Novosphingobium mathurense]
MKTSSENYTEPKVVTELREMGLLPPKSAASEQAPSGDRVIDETKELARKMGLKGFEQ